MTAQDELVEKMAIMLCKYNPWNNVLEEIKEIYRADARELLSVVQSYYHEHIWEIVEVCPDCDGSKTFWNHLTRDREPCVQCSGTGIIAKGASDGK